MRRRIFFVLGMHRSGTSYLTQVLSLMGLDLPISIQPGSEDNPKGHFESFNISRTHDSFFSGLNSSWDTFLPIPEVWFSSEYAKQAIFGLIKDFSIDFPGDKPVVLKDPRLSLFLPLWNKLSETIGLDDYYIIPLRHPLDVAASLNRRNNIGGNRSCLIWLNYIFSAEKYSRGKKRSFIVFPDWAYDIEQVVNKIELDLGSSFPEKNKLSLAKAKNEFERDYVHSDRGGSGSGSGSGSGRLSDDIKDICYQSYQSFIKLTRDPSDPNVLAEIDILRARFEGISSVYAELVVEAEMKSSVMLKQQLASSHIEGEQKLAQLEALQHTLGEANIRLLELEQQLNSSRIDAAQNIVQINQLQQTLSEADSRLLELEQRLALNHDTAKQNIVQVNALQQKLNEADNRVFELEQELASRCAEIERRILKADALQQQLNGAVVLNANLEQELEEKTASILDLNDDINELKAKYHALVEEYDQLHLQFKAEQLTVIRPLYRNVYRGAGLLLRKSIPSAWVDRIKKILPSPDGVPKQLTYQAKYISREIIPIDDFEHYVNNSSPDIFVFSIINWDFRYQRPQHIAKGLTGSGARVFYVEMELSDNKPQIEKIADNLYRARLSSKHTGHIQPYTGQPSVEIVRAWVAAFYELCENVKASSFKQIIIQHPFWWQLARHLPPDFQIIFDCMDDIAGFSNTEKFLLDLEQEMLTECDRLIVSSQYLFDKYKKNQIPKLIRNGADLEHFNKDAKQFATPAFLQLSDSEKLTDIIKVGYVGAIAEWFDASIIRGAALQEPRFEFHLCGAVTSPEAAELASLENVKMYGEITYSDVPGFLNEMDVLIIPFKLVPIIQACDPVKFYEYSAMGKPTVTTALPELARASELTFFASNSEEFVGQIHAAYKMSGDQDFVFCLKDYAKANTWSHRTAQFEEILKDFPKVSIVILAYGDPELTKAVIHSLYDGGPAYPNMQILVVDNGSPPTVLEEIKQFASNYQDVTVIENGKNLGFAKGNNVGIKAAVGEYVMLLNNDTVVAPGAIHSMVRHLDRNPRIGAVGPLTNNIGNEAKLFVEYIDIEQMKYVARQATTGYRGRFTSINVLAYFAVMFRRSDLSSFGLLAEEYGRGMFEDDDHCAMIKSQGYICALAEDAYIHHHLSATFSTLKAGEKEDLFSKNKQIFEKKWGVWRAHQYRESRPMSSLLGGDK